MSGGLGRFLESIEGAGTDVAVDDAECAQCGGNRKPVGVCRFTWVSNSHCFPRSAFVAAQSASGRRELLEAQWTATLEQRVLFQHGLMTEFHPPMAAKNL